ncbi:hypothetical protein [Pandoraea sp. NPDC090278]|uniref:hypothetical protein n=1 Tax=Pandoraea sp. NPDC090278 TaxID=3364391 RepID=UPI00383BE5D9
MIPVSAATISAVPTATRTLHQHLSPLRERFRADLSTVQMMRGRGFRPSVIPDAVFVEPRGAEHPLPILSARRMTDPSAPKPAVDFMFFREPLKANPALIEKWGVAATAGSASEAWSAFVGDIGEQFFKGSRRQRVMDALILSLDILPPERRADAIACLLTDGTEGIAAVEEFWEYVGMERIPHVDRARVAALLLRYEIGK